MPLTDEQRRSLLKQGLNPDDYNTPVSTPEESLAPPIAKINSSNTNPNTSVGGAFGRRALNNALPTMGGGAAFMTTAGALEPWAAATTVPSFGLSQLVPLGAGAIASYLASKGINKLQDAVLPDAAKQQLALDEQEHPTASMLGGIADMPLGGMSPNLSNVGKASGSLLQKLVNPSLPLAAQQGQNLMNVASGALMNPAIDYATARLTGGQAPTGNDLLLSSALGALHNSPNTLGRLYGAHVPFVNARDAASISNNGGIPTVNDGQSQVTPPPITVGTGDMPSTPVETTMQRAADQSQLIALAKGSPPVDSFAAPASPDLINKNIQTGNSIPADQTTEILRNLQERQNKEAGIEQTANPGVDITAGRPEQIVPTPDKSHPANTSVDIDNQINDAQRMLDTPGLPVATKIAAQETLNNLRLKSANLGKELPSATPEDLTKIKPVENTSGVNEKGSVVKTTPETTTGMFSSKVPAETAVDKAMNKTSRYQEKDKVVKSTEDPTNPRFTVSPSLNSPEMQNRLQALAGQHNVKLVKDASIPSDIAGQIFKNGAKDTVARLNPTAAGIDTPHHEILHALFSYMKNSKMESLRKFASAGEALHGGEEPFVQKAGEDAMNRFVNRPKGVSAGVKEWYNDFKSFWKYRLGNATPEDMARIMSHYHLFDNETGSKYGGGEGNVGGVKNQPREDITNDKGDAARLTELKNNTNLTPDEVTERDNLQKKSDSVRSEMEKNFWKTSEPTTKEQPSNQANTEVTLGMPKPRFTGERTGEEKLPYASTPVVRPLLDVIRKTAGEQGNTLADAVEQFYNKERANRGSFDPSMKAIGKLSRGESDELYKNFLTERRTQESGRENLSSDKLKGAYDTIRENLKQKQLDQIKAGEPVIDLRGKVPFARPAKVDPYYFPMSPSAEALDTLLNHPQTPDAKTLKEDFLNYNTERGIKPEDANEKLNQYLSAFGGKEFPNQTKFGANRLAEGVGLPDSWIEPNMNKAMERYVRRASKDRAWYDSVESNHDIAKMLGAKKDAWLKPIASDSTDISSMRPVKDLMQNIQGAHEAGEINANAVAKVATSLALGPLTAVHIAGTSPFGLMAFSKAGDIPGLLHSYTKAFEGVKHAFATGYAHRDVTFGREFLEATTKFSDKMNSLSRFITKISGREHLDYFTKGLLQAGSEFLIDKNIARARAGDKDAADLLSNVDKKFDYTRDDVTPEEKQQLASGLASYVHGDYNAKTMPGWMLRDGFVAPFFKLASWNIGQTNHFARNIYTPATKGNFSPLIMSTLGAVVGGALVKYTREKLSDKKSPIPSLSEIVNSDPSKSGLDNITSHPGLGLYNLAAMTSYSGYMGIVSQLAKTGFDAAYKNKPQGAMFPLDEMVSNTAKTLSDGYTALMNEPGEDYPKIAAAMLKDLLKDNIQMSRLAMTYMTNAGYMPQEKEQKDMAGYNRDQKAFKMVSGLPYEAQSSIETNPYMDMDEKRFKKTEDLKEAADLLPSMIQEKMRKAGGNFEVFKSEMAGLKGNNYSIMPNLESEPMTFMRYYNYVKSTQGESAANNLVQQYYKRNTINKIKSSVVPSF